MAKKKEKTLEEKLQEALVPENQWPYMLPENWCWTYVEFIADKIKRGKSPKYVEKSLFPVFAQKCNQKDGTIALEKARFLNPDMASKISDYVFLREDDIVINSTGTGTLGRVGFIRKKDMLGYKQILPDSHVTTVRGMFCVNKSYLYMFLKMKQAYLELQGSGSTNQKELRPDSIGTIEFPLPPLLEQKRIVHRIESLFAKLNEAKEKIQQVLDGAEMRKAAILHKAFTGELTKTWRRENNITTTDDVNREKLSKECEEYEIPYEIPDEWRWVTFNEVCTFIGSGVTPKGGQAVYTDSGIPFIRSQNVLNGKLDLSDVAYISDEINEKMKRTQIIGGETLLNITGASIGRSCYVPQEQSVGNVNQHVCILRFKNYINGYIPQLWLNSPKMQEFINFNQVGQTRQALNFKQIRGIYFPLPPLQEQLEMVRIIKYEINKLDVVCNSLANLAVRIDTMKKSILAKAFRGELGTNNPTEDSALNLLKEVLQDKF